MPVRLALCIHSHQPTGNFDHVIEEAYRKAYWPFLKTLGRFPWFHVSMHTSGSLLLWIEQHHPEYFRLLRQLVRRGQVEMLTSGLYEPILTVIPEADRQVQVRKMTEYLRQKFGAKAIGAWMTERVWEPELARTLADAGVQYSLLDDTHFLRAGLEAAQLTGPFITDDSGRGLTLFPTQRFLRYHIPYAPPAETVRFLRSFRETPNALIGYGDDGEKFGVWPGTDVLCWNKRWVERFIRSLKAAKDIEVVTFSQALAQVPTLGRVYPPTSSYEEMSEWTLPPAAGKIYRMFHEELRRNRRLERYGRFIHGGHFRSFFAKYEEVNWLQKRMLNTRQRIVEVERRTRRSFPSAWDELFRAQGNDVYWHGAFGGAYSTHLRHLAYTHLLKAERSVEKTVHHGRPWVEASVSDLDLDGNSEVSLENDRLRAIVAPHRGGIILELDDRRRAMNLVNTMRRREETYHEHFRKLLRQQPRKGKHVRSIHELWNPIVGATEADLIVDSYRRGSFVDHLLPLAANLRRFSRNLVQESLSLATTPYDSLLRRSRDRVTLVLNHQMNIDGRPLLFTKRISLQRGTAAFHVEYTLKNPSRKTRSLWFGTELVTNLLADDEQRAIILNADGERRSMKEIAAHEGVFTIAAQADDLGVRTSWELSQPLDLWRFPIETVSSSESGFEKHHQGVVCFVHRKLVIDPGERWTVSIRQSVG